MSEIEKNPYEIYDAQERWWTGPRLVLLGMATLAVGLIAILLAAHIIGE